MAKRLADFHRGDSKSWPVRFDYDVNGSTIVFRMSKTLEQLEPDLEVLLSITESTSVVFVVITAEMSAALDVGSYFSEHRIKTATGQVTTFLSQRISVLPTLPKGVAVF